MYVLQDKKSKMYVSEYDRTFNGGIRYKSTPDIKEAIRYKTKRIAKYQATVDRKKVFKVVKI